MLAGSQAKPPVCVAFALVLLGATLHLAGAEATEYEPAGRTVSKRGPTVGLFAFPRVGRSDPELNVDWEASPALLPMETGDDYGITVGSEPCNGLAYPWISFHSPSLPEDYPMKEMKRQGLVPFPRVGRSGKSELAMAAARYWQAARNLQQQQQSLVKRASGSGTTGAMWFGPRLGKRGRFGAASAGSSSEQQQLKAEQL
uniref:Uncharacterized protein n=1 Tax=Anopheles epiroticus TaxID=199890 RepID=A0A182PV04_9DIPT